ncbi:putative manganese efflux pump MntP [bioreactor metagenome]|uniref:Putative manganese efflux pump MntP n=2 Tax=root TaxID=1 RepID=A0A652ZSX0_9SPIR|nr:manganese efflux pump MntP family protein [Spirochaetales bacterium]VBB38846.1 putative manganese efflux pump MntP [uncultured Spirochaetota bacterium]HOI22990.1 manganese efflux pump MntP family protein [Spirochaetales bacterium]
MDSILLTSFLMGLALSMDALAVSISASICTDSIPRAVSLRAAAFFGFFQFAMPLTGWLLGSTFRQLIQGYDHWIAFGLLAFVGGKMLWEGIRVRIPAYCPDPDEIKDHGIMKIHSLLLLALATSIDALAVGLSLCMIGSPILWPSVIIGVTTFVVCLLGIQFGKNLKRLFGDWADIVGGIVLIGIGTKILIEHLIAHI